MKKIVMAGFCIIAATFVNAQTIKTGIQPAGQKNAVKPVKPVTPVMKTLLDSFSYAAGLNIAQSMKEQGVTGLNNPLLLKAIDDVFKNNTAALTPEQANMTLQKQLMQYAQKKSAAEKAKGKAFLDANKQRKGVITLPNGLQYEVVKEGEANGIKPKITDSAVVHYAGTLINGNEFDNSFKRGEPYTTLLTDVITGWTEILKLMTKGAQWKVYIPSELGYGDRGNGPGIPPGSVLIFDMQLVDIKPVK